MDRISRAIASLAVPSALLGVVLLPLALFAPYYWTQVWWEIHKQLFWLIPAGIVWLVASLLWSTIGGEDDASVLAGGMVLVLTVPFLGWLLWFGGSYHSFKQAQDYATSIRAVTDAVPGLNERAPFTIADKQVRPNLGDIPGDASNTTHLPAGNQYTTLVERRGWWNGYDVTLTQEIPLTGRGVTARVCRFDKKTAARRLTAFGSHNLGRLINTKKRFVNWSPDDAYGWCDGNTPKVIIPLKRQVGVFYVTERPAGVAIYNGTTGELEIREDTAGLPGPTYPLSLAAKQREASKALKGYSAWWFNRAGWEATNDEVNAENPTEFVLATKDQRTVYVTPLTGRGSATSISAIAVLPATSHGLGLAPLTVHRLPTAWVSPDAIVKRIKGDYQDLPNWQNLRVFEITPFDGGSWVATIGNDQNVLYRVRGTGPLNGDKPTCLYLGDGTLIRCGSVANVGANGPGTQYGPPVPNGSTGVSDLSKLNDQQLADLQRRITDEYNRRLAQRGTR